MNLKELIREKATEQPVLKNQRKTVHLVGPRTVEPGVAVDKHRNNRYDLRLLYIAYAIVRGRDPLTSVANYQGADSWEGRQVAKLVEQYTIVATDETVRTD